MSPAFSLLAVSFSVLVFPSSASGRVKRKAPDRQMYVFSAREGCESVRSEAPCTLNWKLNPYLAKVYNQSNEIVAIKTKVFSDLGINHDCVQALEKALCSQVVPRCLADGSRSYGDASKLCQNAYDICPHDVVSVLKQNSFCHLLTGKHPNSGHCVAATTRVIGVCPQPKFKMPSEFLTEYRAKSSYFAQYFDEIRKQRYGDNGNRIYSDECISQIEDINCSPLYCSEDENLLLIKHDREDCYRHINECFTDMLSKLSGSSSRSLRIGALALRQRLKSQCDTYPEASTAQLHPEPPLPTSAGSRQFAQLILLVAALLISKICA